jgi:hypothetical protein
MSSEKSSKTKRSREPEAEQPEPAAKVVQYSKAITEEDLINYEQEYRATVISKDWEKTELQESYNTLIDAINEAIKGTIEGFLGSYSVPYDVDKELQDVILSVPKLKKYVFDKYTNVDFRIGDHDPEIKNEITANPIYGADGKVRYTVDLPHEFTNKCIWLT